MRTLLFSAAVALLAFGCKSPKPTMVTDPPPVPGTPGTVVSILHGTSYGHCVGYCIKEETYKELIVEARQTSRDAATYPDKVVRRPLSDGEFSDLIAYIDWNKWNQLETVIGCPDCADGGGEYIEIQTTTGTKRVTFDANSNPEGLEKLLGLLRKNRESMEQ